MPISEKDIFLKISQATSRISNLERLLKRSVKISAQAVGVDLCSIWLTDDDKKYAMVKAVYVRGRFDPVHLGARVDLNKFPKFKRIISEGKIIHSPDISKLVANRPEKKFFAKAEIKSSLSVPLKIKSKILGALNWGTLKNYKTFTPSEIRLCQTIANQIAVGIENVRLYKKLEHRASLLQGQSIKALRESEEKYRTLLENLPQLIFLKDKKSVYISANKNYCKSLGIKPEEIKGKTDFDFFPKELAKKYRKDDRDIIKTGRTKEIIEDYIEKGERKIVQTVKTPVLGDGGKPVGVLGIFWDITERKKVEQETEAQKRKLETYIESITDGVSVNDVNGIITHANATCLEMYGCKSKEEMIGKPIFEFVAENELPRIRKRFMQAVNTKEKTIKNLEIIARKKDGSEFPVLLSTAFIWDEEGNLADNITIIKDITERKRGEEKLHYFQKAVDSSSDAIGMSTPKGKHYYQNEAVTRLFGMTAEEVNGKSGPPSTVYVDEKVGREVFATIMRGDSWIGEVKMFNKNRDKIDVFLRAYSIKDEKGRVIGLVGVHTDITERKRGEEVTRKEKERAERYLNIAAVMLATVNADENITLINKKGCEILDYKEEELIGRNWFDTLVPERIRSEVRDVFGKLIAGDIEPVEYYENPLLTREGEERLIAFHNTVIRDPNGQIVGVLTSGEDITERKKVEEKLKKSEERYRTLVETSNDMIFTVDSRGKFLFTNKAFEKILGYSDEEIKKINGFELIHPQDLKIVKKQFAQLLKGKNVDNMEYRYKTKDGSYIHILNNASPIFDSQGNVVATFGIARDITEHKKADEALRESEEKIKNIFASIGDSITVTDLKGNITECNQATLDLHCLSSKEEILGRSALDFIAPKDHTRAKRNMKKTLEQGFIKDVEYTLLTKDKREFPGELSASVVRGASGKPAAFVAITKDISERKKAEKALRKSKDLNTILQISYKTTQILNLDKMLELACQEIAKTLEVEKCVVLLLDEKENAGIIKAIYIKNQPHPSILGARLLLKDFPILVKLYQQKERFLHAPVIKNAPLSRKEKDYFRKEKVKSFVIVPIDTGKRLLGTFLVGTMEKERVFTESEIAFVQTLANHLAIAVENAKLMELVKGQAENLKFLSERVIRTQEEERKKIAQELHDEIGQALTAMKINIEMSKQKIPSEFTQVIDRIKENEELIVQTLEKVRNLTTDLRPPMLDDFGLIPTLNWYIQNFSKRTNIKVTLKTNHCRGRLPLDLEMVLYRINQEALTNVAKHANATRVSITLEKKNNYALFTVKDNGIGFNIKKIMSERKVKKGFGLFDIKERVKLLSGDFSITSKPKKGTRLQVRIPCPRGR